MAELFLGNFGGYILALIVVLLLYAFVEQFAPQYAAALAFITLLGIVMFQLNRKRD